MSDKTLDVVWSAPRDRDASAERLIRRTLKAAGIAYNPYSTYIITREGVALIPGADQGWPRLIKFAFKR